MYIYITYKMFIFLPIFAFLHIRILFEGWFTIYNRSLRFTTNGKCISDHCPLRFIIECHNLVRMHRYRVSHMNRVDFKELLWFRFLCQTFFSIIIMVEKCVHFDIWNKKNFSIFQRSHYDFAHLLKI